MSWAAKELQALAKKLADGRAKSLFADVQGDIGVRAGRLKEGQRDAFVWGVNELENAVRLTINRPSLYDSVCIVVGTKEAPPNGKFANMAHMIDPREVLVIEGRDLEALQGILERLYTVPYLRCLPNNTSAWRDF